MLLRLANFSSEFHLRRCKRDSLAIAEVIFIQSYDIHFNPQPTTVNILINLIQCQSNFTFILELTYQNKLWSDPFQKEKQRIKFKFCNSLFDLKWENEYQKLSFIFQIWLLDWKKKIFFFWVYFDLKSISKNKSQNFRIQFLISNQEMNIKKFFHFSVLLTKLKNEKWKIFKIRFVVKLNQENVEHFSNREEPNALEITNAVKSLTSFLNTHSNRCISWNQFLHVFFHKLLRGAFTGRQKIKGLKFLRSFGLHDQGQTKFKPVV